MKIERKFVLKWEIDRHKLKELGICPDHHEIIQYYLPNSIRVRRDTIPGVRTTFMVNLKAATRSKFSRHEWKAEVPEWVFNKIAEHNESRGIRKRRTSWIKDGLKFDLDHFHGLDIELLEIEFTSVEQALAFDPNCLGLPIEAEVTYDPAFQNYNIAMERG
jgi:CYTH domain-containing protein